MAKKLLLCLSFRWMLEWSARRTDLQQTGCFQQMSGRMLRKVQALREILCRKKFRQCSLSTCRLEVRSEIKFLSVQWKAGVRWSLQSYGKKMNRPFYSCLVSELQWGKVSSEFTKLSLEESMLVLKITTVKSRFLEPFYFRAASFQ